MLGRYWHTLRHLRPVQLYGRVWFRIARPRPDRRPAPPVRPRPQRWIVPAARQCSMVGPGRVRLLNVTRSLEEHVWDDPKLEKLWRYNLHYFDDLACGTHDPLHVEWQRELLLRWVASNPPGAGTGWEPYPTSLRIVNWIKWHWAGHTLPSECTDSLAVQARWLSRRLEMHLLGNHLFANAKALVFAGLFFDGREARSWLDRGLAILAHETLEQILPDGGHFERSPMYHALALEDLLDLWNAVRSRAEPVGARSGAFVSDWPRLIGGMRRWLAAMCHPDGEISFFNDAAMGVAPAPQALEHYASRLGLPAPGAPDALEVLGDSGYVCVRQGALVALLDVAPVGPDYLPGHAHADTLSFELSLHGHRVFVNSGTSRYGIDAERLRQRGTAAHNTVVVDGLDSSEVWSGFRVARRARPFGLTTLCDADGIGVACAHDGYTRLPGRPVHERHWRCTASSFQVEDRLTGPPRAAEARWHLHPSVRAGQPCRRDDGSTVTVLTLPGGAQATVAVASGDVELVAASWHPAFGVDLPTQCLRIPLVSGRSLVTMRWNE